MLLFVIISVIILIAVFLLVFLLVPFRLYIFYQRDAAIDMMRVDIKYLFFTFHLVPKKNKEKKITALKEQNKEISFDDFKKMIEQFCRNFDIVKEDIIDILRFLTQKLVVIDKLRLRCRTGFENAMVTGMSIGILNGVVYNILAWIHRHSNIRKWDIEITPDFDQKRFDLETECILKIKSVHIMIIAIKGLKIYFKLSK